MSCIGVIVHMDRAEATTLARHIGADLAAAGHDLRVPEKESVVVQVMASSLVASCCVPKA